MSTEETMLLVMLDEFEIELIGMFLRGWREIIDIEDESPDFVARLEQFINRLKKKLKIKNEE